MLRNELLFLKVFVIVKWHFLFFSHTHYITAVSTKQKKHILIKIKESSRIHFLFESLDNCFVLIQRTENYKGKQGISCAEIVVTCCEIEPETSRPIGQQKIRSIELCAVRAE